MEDMQASLAWIDSGIASVSTMTANGNGLDSQRVKAILPFISEKSNAGRYRPVLDRFVTYEGRTDTRTDEDGAEHTETHTVAAPIASLEKTAAIFNRNHTGQSDCRGVRSIFSHPQTR